MSYYENNEYLDHPNLIFVCTRPYSITEFDQAGNAGYEYISLSIWLRKKLLIILNAQNKNWTSNYLFQVIIECACNELIDPRTVDISIPRIFLFTGERFDVCWRWPRRWKHRPNTPAIWAPIRRDLAQSGDAAHHLYAHVHELPSPHPLTFALSFREWESPRSWPPLRVRRRCKARPRRVQVRKNQ